MASSSASSGEATISGSAVSSQCAITFAATIASSGSGGMPEQQQRAVLVVARNSRSSPSSIERNAAIQTMPGARRDSVGESGPDGKGHDHPDHHEEQHQRQRIAADPGRQPQVACG